MSHLQSAQGSASAIDMSQFFQVFFEEAAEHLEKMENLLLAIDPANPGSEELNAIFRCAHSIKGGSGTFGFKDMAELMHAAETLLDRVRRGELALSTPMIDALLAAGDVLGAQLARHRGESAEIVDAQPATARLSDLARDSTACAAAARSLHLHFQLAAQANFDVLLAGLSRFGEITTLIGPNAARLCTVGFITSVTDEHVRGVLGPAVDPGSLRFEVAAAEDSGYGLISDDAPAADLPPADPGYGFFDTEPPAAAADATTPAAYPEWGRRKTDHPDIVTAPAGRRTDDKQVVSPNAESASIRVKVDKVDQLINLVGELVITQAMLARKTQALETSGDASLSAGMADLDRNTRDLQEAVMSIRMLPISNVFNRFPRMLRDLSARLGKQIELRVFGEQTELDKGVVEKISDPMNHLLRNAADHGIESPDVRIAAGKPAHGTLTLRAYHQGATIVIEVADDGKGLDRERILAKAGERGLLVAEDMSDRDVWQLIFEPGFSTAEKVTDISGRGVGMDVVKKNILALGGSVELESPKGQGTRVTVRLPLTLAIIEGMSVAVGGDTYVIPLGVVVELLQPGSREIRTVTGQGCVIELRSEFLPVISLANLFGGGASRISDSESIIVVVELDGAKTALLVDELVGQHQVVVKSIEANYRRVPGVSGATIMADGTVALIMDVAALVKLARH